MALDPRKLRPGELCRLVNSTPRGEVISERQLHRHRTRAGYRVVAEGDDKRIDLLRYVAWLVTTRHSSPPRGEAECYEAYRTRKAVEARAMSLSGRDIGRLPDVENPERRASCELPAVL